MRIVDSAARLRTGESGKDVSELLALMDRSGIVHAVVAPDDAAAAVNNESGNSQMAGLMSKYPDRFLCLAVANPWYGPAAVQTLEKAFARGLCGLYLHPGRQGFHLTESIVHPLIDVCSRCRKPVYSHTGTPVCSEPFQLAELARQFPDVTFVMGHAGYPDFWYDVADSLGQAPNLFVETSCQTAPVIQSIIETVGPERILFGSGWPCSSPVVEIQKIEQMGLMPEVFQQVMSTNAERVWEIKP